MFRSIALLVIASFAMSVTGCGETKPTQPTSTTPAKLGDAKGLNEGGGQRKVGPPQ